MFKNLENKLSLVILIIILFSLLSLGFVEYTKTIEDNLFSKARIFIMKEEYNTAVDLLTKILEQDPDNFEVKYLIGDIKLNERNFNDAFKQVKDILINDPENKKAIDLGNRIFYEALIFQDINEYRTFLFNSCDYSFNVPHPEVERFIVNLLKNKQYSILTEFSRIDQKGSLTIYTLSNIYSSFLDVIPVLTKYYTYKNIEGIYPARIAIENIKEEELIRRSKRTS
ncbi:MAG: tetratricopeptide repeat protein [Candidatus Firestonebacteria bacterium]|nr:tetratricopeptide repeat protein [Candidatus Firestonebacteria bacterium]